MFRNALYLENGWHPENSFPLVVFMTRILLLNMPQAHREDGARLDIAAKSFWRCDLQHAFFDVLVFNPFTPSYRF